MPENSSQFDTHTQTTMSDFSEMTAADIKKKIAEKNEELQNGEAKKGNTPTNGEAARSTVESEAHKNEKQNDNTDKKEGRDLPSRPSKNDQSVEQSKGREKNESETNELDHSGSDKPPTPDYANNENKEDDQVAQGSEITTSEIKKKKRRQPIKERQIHNGNQDEGSGSRKEVKSESKSTKESSDKKRRSENIRVKERPSIAKIISIDSPVILGSLIEGLESDDAWFLKEELEGDDEMDALIIKKNPSNQILEEKKVKWDDIAPQFETVGEYSDALTVIIKEYNRASEEKNTDYQHHLARLLMQVRHYAQIFRNKEKRALKNKDN